MVLVGEVDLWEYRRGCHDDAASIRDCLLRHIAEPCTQPRRPFPSNLCTHSQLCTQSHSHFHIQRIAACCSPTGLRPEPVRHAVCPGEPQPGGWEGQRKAGVVGGRPAGRRVACDCVRTGARGLVEGESLPGALASVRHCTYLEARLPFTPSALPLGPQLERPLVIPGSLCMYPNHFSPSPRPPCPPLCRPDCPAADSEQPSGAQRQAAARAGGLQGATALHASRQREGGRGRGGEGERALGEGVWACMPTAVRLWARLLGCMV